MTSALALPETTNAEIVTKTTAINNALAVLNIELTNADISAAKALIPSTITVVEGTHTNLLTVLQEIGGMDGLGVTLTAGSSENVNIGSDGTITYTDTAVSGNITININKPGGTEQTVTIIVTVPKKITYALKPVTLSYNFGTHISSYDPNTVFIAAYIEKEYDSGTITNLKYESTGNDPTAFAVSPVFEWRNTLTDAESYNHIKIHPVEGLAPGKTYTAELVITADNGIRISGTLKFAVSY